MPRLRPAAALPLALFLLACASQAVDERAPDPQGTAAGRTDPRPGPVGWQNGWAHGGVFYEVFVRSFADSDGDGKGDLPGLISRLDYLNDGDPATGTDLGVDALWLMPVFRSPSYHGYDTTDYESVNPDYGTNEDFSRLCEEAHRRGMKVIVDLVLNHTGSGHPWFVESASSPSSPRRDWYVWSDTNRGWTQPWGGSGPTWHAGNGAFYYGVFWSGMPDLNYRTSAVREEMKRIAALWLARGVDGFRLDAVRYLVENGAGPLQQDQGETHAYWKELAAYVRSVKPEALLVGESWAETGVIASYYGSGQAVPGGDELPMTFDFPLSDAIVRGVTSGSPAGIAAKLKDVGLAYPPGALDAPFLTNHDQVRLATQLQKSGSKLRNASAILLTLPGTPFLYYGEEVGLENGPGSGDEAKRTPMPWDATAGGGFTTGTPWYAFAPGRETANVAAQTNDPGSLLSRYRRLIRARKSSNALQGGDFLELSPGSRSSSVLAFLRRNRAETVLVAHNLSDSFATVGPFAVAFTSMEVLFADPGAATGGGSGALSVTLPPRASGVWRVRPFAPAPRP